MNQLPYLPPVITGETRPQDTARYELDRSITPLWGREGIKNAKEKRANKRVVGKELLSLAEDARHARLAGRAEMPPTRNESPNRMSVPEAPPAGYRRPAAPNQGIFNGFSQQQQQQQQQQRLRQSPTTQQPQTSNRRQQPPPPQQQQQQQQQQRLRQQQFQQLQSQQQRQLSQYDYDGPPRGQQLVQRAPSPVRVSDALYSDNNEGVILDGTSSSVERMLIEERTNRKLQQAEIERLSALAHRNDAAIKDRTAFLEKLRLRDSVELRELRERLRTVESELGEQRAMGSGGNSSNNNTGNQGARSPSNSNGVLPRGSRPMLRSSSVGSGDFRGGGGGGSGGGGGKDSSAVILNELRARDSRDNDAREKQEQRRLELWQHNMTLQKRLEEQRQQMSEFALRSADRLSSLEARLNERDASIVRLEARETGTSQALASTEVQTEATLSSVVSSMEHLQNKLAREVEQRTKMEETYRTENAELRRLLFSTEKGIASSIENSVQQLWEKDAADRSRSKQVRNFVEQRYLHERDSVYQWAERLESTLASERNDRLRFEKELRSMNELKVSAIEATAMANKTTNDMRGEEVKTKTEIVLTKMIQMLNSYKSDADEQRENWERKTYDTIGRLSKDVKMLSGTSMGSTSKLEEVLRAEIRTRERKMKEDAKETVEREREIDNRAKAVESSLRASVDGFDDRIRSVEERVNSSLAGFRAQMENDIKTSTDSMAKMLLDLDGAVQMLSIRIDSNDAERRSSLGNFNTRLAEVRRMTVSRAELESTTNSIKKEMTSELRKVSEEVARVESVTLQKMETEMNERSTMDAQIKMDMDRQITNLKKEMKSSWEELNVEMIQVTDKERTERILKDASSAEESKLGREELRAEIKRINFANLQTTQDSIDVATKKQADIRGRDISSSETKVLSALDEKMNSLRLRTDQKCEDIVNTTGAMATEASKLATEADKNAGQALSKIDTVVDESKHQLETLSTELRAVVQEGAGNIKEKSEKLEKDVESRLIDMESALRRSFEEQASSLRALTQANLAAEAAVRLREDTRVRQEVDSRLKEQQKWVGEFTEYKAEKIARKLGKLVKNEAQARQLSTRQVHREIAYEMDKSSEAVQIRAALESVIGTLVERDTQTKVNSALSQIKNVTQNLEKKISNELAKKAKDDKRHLAQSLRRVQTQFTEVKRDTDDVRRNGEVASCLDSLINQVIEQSQHDLLKDTTKNIMRTEVRLARVLSRASSRGSSGLDEKLQLMKEMIEEEKTARGDEDSRIDESARMSKESMEESLNETKAKLDELKAKVEQYQSNNTTTAEETTPPPAEVATEEAAPVENEWDEMQNEEGETYWKNKNTGDETYEDPN